MGAPVTQRRCRVLASRVLPLSCPGSSLAALGYYLGKQNQENCSLLSTSSFLLTADRKADRPILLLKAGKVQSIKHRQPQVGSPSVSLAPPSPWCADNYRNTYSPTSWNLSVCFHLLPGRVEQWCCVFRLLRSSFCAKSDHLLQGLGV